MSYNIKVDICMWKVEVEIGLFIDISVWVLTFRGRMVFVK